MSDYQVITGDSVLVLPKLDVVVDAIVTDPPYSSGGMFRGDRTLATSAKYVGSDVVFEREDFEGDTRDQRSFGFWTTMWAAQCLQLARPGAVLCAFTDWRQLPVMTDAIQAGGWVWRGVFVWDKTEGTRPRMGGFRSQCEYVVWASKGPLVADKEVGVLPGLVRGIRSGDDRIHQTGKPIFAMRELVKVCRPGGLVLDPFTGSGSTGVAALLEGRRFLGIEASSHWADVARARLAAEVSGVGMRGAARGQVGLFEKPETDSP